MAEVKVRQPSETVDTRTVGPVTALIIAAVTLVFLVWGFIFLRDAEVSKAIIVPFAIVWGVGGIALLYTSANWLVEQLPDKYTSAIQPFVFVGPALIILGYYLFIPAIRTLYLSFYDRFSENWVGLDNYVFAFTDEKMLIAFRNNLLWLILVTFFTIVFGLLIAVLADRTKFESAAKSLIFLPMAISFVGASVIWKFIYAFKPFGEQIGLWNAIVTAFGGDPVGWLLLRPWNNLFLIIILIWLQTGFSMVLLSAALKGVPDEILEAGRIDGANEVQIFFRIIIPTIMGTIITVATTTIILTLKVFDIVFVMTSGEHGTEVIANQMYRQMFKFQDFGRGSAVAIVLLVAVLPVMWYNLRQFREQDAL